VVGQPAAKAQGRSDDGTAGAGKPELAGVGAAQTAEGQRKPGRERQEHREHRKVSWVSWVSSVEWTKPEGGTGRGCGNSRLPRSVEPIVAETGHLESNVVGTKNPRRGGPERVGASRRDKNGESRSGSAPRSYSEGESNLRRGSFSDPSSATGGSAPRQRGVGQVREGGPVAKYLEVRTRERNGQGGGTRSHGVLRDREKTSVEDANPMRGRARDGNVARSYRRRRSSLWRGEQRRE